ncbi:hypothetical protein T492DRAFT_364924 [Pavlovales sp. CCMP2436]|nr:hypothetical protein T492DRAFT_364924 [Pavlovales sp. CCMP2436]
MHQLYPGAAPQHGMASGPNAPAQQQGTYQPPQHNGVGMASWVRPSLVAHPPHPVYRRGGCAHCGRDAIARSASYCPVCGGPVCESGEESSDSSDDERFALHATAAYRSRDERVDPAIARETAAYGRTHRQPYAADAAARVRGRHTSNSYSFDAAVARERERDERERDTQRKSYAANAAARGSHIRCFCYYCCC